MCIMLCIMRYISVIHVYQYRFTIDWLITTLSLSENRQQNRKRRQREGRINAHTVIVAVVVSAVFFARRSRSSRDGAASRTTVLVVQTRWEGRPRRPIFFRCGRFPTRTRLVAVAPGCLVKQCQEVREVACRVLLTEKRTRDSFSSS